MDVRGNPLAIAVAVSGLTKLNHLALDGSKLTDFVQQAPSNIQRNTRTVDIRGTIVSSLPSHLTSLQSLDTLYIDEFSNTNYYPIVCHHLVEAAAHGQDLAVPPREAVQGGQDAVDAYYGSLEKTAASRQKRAIVVVIGKSMAGKTSLVNALEEVLIQHRRKERSKGGRRSIMLN